MAKTSKTIPYVLLAVVAIIAFCFAAGVKISSWAVAAPEDADALPADQPIPEEMTPFEKRVQVIAMSCAACHGTEGRLRTAIPSLAGQPAPVMQAQLLAFKQDQMPSATVMPRLAKGYSDEELIALAAYFASLKKKPKAGDAL